MAKKNTATAKPGDADWSVRQFNKLTADEQTLVNSQPPNIGVLERRLQNPFGDASIPIRLKAPGWTLHVINANLRPGRYHDVVRNKGWVPVEASEIDGDPMDFGFDVKDGRVVRGERGSEILVKMPTEWYERIQRRKSDMNQRQLQPASVKGAAVERTAKAYGDQAADAVESMTLNATRGPVPLESGEETA
jgi:hypothetical protein